MKWHYKSYIKDSVDHTDEWMRYCRSTLAEETDQVARTHFEAGYQCGYRDRSARQLRKITADRVMMSVIVAIGVIILLVLVFPNL